MADWADLPPDILYVIVQKSAFMEDLITFAAVCKSWSSSVAPLLSNKPPLPLRSPWLMLAGEKNEQDQSLRGFFNLSSRKIHKLQLPEVTGRRCVGAYKGWLLTLGRDLQISLLHPFSRRQISLPSLLKYNRQYKYCGKLQPKDFIDIFISKLVFSSDPLMAKESCVVMTVYGEISLLGFARPGDERWTDVKLPSRSYDDIVFYRDQFYVVDCHGVVVVCDLDADQVPTAKVIAPAPSGTKDEIQKYLVESSGELLLVQRIREGTVFGPGPDDEGEEEYIKEKKCDGRRYYTVGFTILKMEKCCNEEESKYPYKWSKVDSLGDKALFLSSSSTSVSVKDYDGCIKANCIYFTDDNPELYNEIERGGRDMGIYHLESGTIQPHFSGESLCHLAPPTWII